MRGKVVVAAAGAAVLLLAGLLVVPALRGSGVDGGSRLVVHGADGAITVMSPDGTNRVEISGPAAEGRRHTQPTWSPDGSLLGWADAGEEDSLLHVVGADGSAARSTPIRVPPFYLSWSPAGDRLAGLGASGEGIILFLAAVGDGAFDVREIDEGAPYYFDWSPDGSGLLVHVGVDVLADLDVDSGRRSGIDDITPGRFDAPIWLADGRRAYARQGTVRQAIVLEMADGAPEAVVDFDGRVAFDLAGGRIAYRADGGGSGLAVTAANGSRPVPAPPGVLAVLDVETARQTVVERGPVLAFEWSPDGSRLLFLAPEGQADGRMRWNTWDGEVVVAHEVFTPTSLYLRDYQPFFDQYARSQTAWSPESDAFAYAGTAADGVSGIWVQRLDGSAPVVVAQGDMVSWSPSG